MKKKDNQLIIEIREDIEDCVCKCFKDKFLIEEKDFNDKFFSLLRRDMEIIQHIIYFEIENYEIIRFVIEEKYIERTQQFRYSFSGIPEQNIYKLISKKLIRKNKLSKLD
jgi:hypothetical protein